MIKVPRELKGKDETLDTFYHGRILVLQKLKGYRFSVDAPLLADFIRTEKEEHILELGTGSGIISLLLTIKPFREITAVEIQDSLADLARRNVRLNSAGERIRIVQQDFRSFSPGRKYDVIFSNPPYIKGGEGHLSESPEKSIAKHELKSDIFVIMQKTAELLKKDGRAYFVFPEKRKDDFMQAAKEKGLILKAIRHVCPRQGSRPVLFLSLLSFTSGEKVEWPPLVLFDEKGWYTEEVDQIFAGRTCD